MTSYSLVSPKPNKSISGLHKSSRSRLKRDIRHMELQLENSGDVLGRNSCIHWSSFFDIFAKSSACQ